MDPQEKIRMVLARQARQRNKMTILEQQKQKNAGTSASTPSTSSITPPAQAPRRPTSQGERLAKMDAVKTEEPSAMELFLAAVEESKQKKEQRKKTAQSSSTSANATSVSPAVSSSPTTSAPSTETVTSASQETTNQPLMGNRLILTVEG